MTSTNWIALTEALINGELASKKEERMYSTTDAKSIFKLETRDICKIRGYRRQEKVYGGGNNLTLYFHSDLEDFAIKLMGKVKYDEMVFARAKREANAKARYEKELIEEKERAERQAREAILAEERRVKQQKEMAQQMEIAAAKAAAKAATMAELTPEAVAAIELEKCTKAAKKTETEHTGLIHQMKMAEMTLASLKAKEVSAKRKHEAASEKLAAATEKWELVKKAKVEM